METGLVLSTAYFPPVQYFAEINKASDIFIEAHENYSRQTYRNRCCILSGSGKLTLSVPVQNIPGIKQLITGVKIDNSSNWQRIHIHAIRSAYGKSPFFHYYAEDILEPIVNLKSEYLFDLNNKILTTIIRILKINKKTYITTSYEPSYPAGINDCRNSIHPKKYPGSENKPKYIQTFSDRFDFISNLSILDLIFNTGPESARFLK